MSITDFFNSVVNIERAAYTTDDMGNDTVEWERVVTNLAGCIQPRRGFEIVTHNKRQSEVTHVFYCLPTALDIQPSDRLVFRSMTYDILDIRDNDYLGRFFTIDLKQVMAD